MICPDCGVTPVAWRCFNVPGDHLGDVKWDEGHRLNHTLWIDALADPKGELYITSNVQELRLRCTSGAEVAIADLREDQP